MSVEYTIERHRRRIEIIDMIEKENILKTFDKTVSLYKEGYKIKKIAKTIADAAEFTESEEAIIETAKTLQLYNDKEEAEEVAEAITHAGFQTKSEEAVIETAKTLTLYYDKEIVWEVAKIIEETAKFTRSEKAVIEVAKTLALYYDKKEAEIITEIITHTASQTRSRGVPKEVTKTLRNIKDIYNLDLKLFYSYITHISDKISKNIKYSLLLKDINKITETYSLTMDFCKDDDYEFKKKVKEGFFHHLNKAMDNGKTIDDKIKIMNKWSDNVYTTFKDHPEDFMEFIR